MRSLIGALRLCRAVLQVLKGLLVMALRFPSLDEAGRHERIRWWSAGVLRSLGIELRAGGAPHPGAALMAANHVSWLDIIALHAVAPHARFVSKADVLAWPLLGWMVRTAGTLFIERERKRDAVRVVHAMAEALRAGQTVAVFPEGTTGAGPQLLPFHANLLQAAISTGTPVQPVVLRFSDESGRFSQAVEFLGETTLLQSVWRIARARHLLAHVELLAPLSTAGADRRDLAAQLQGRIQAALGGPGAGQVSGASH